LIETASDRRAVEIVPAHPADFLDQMPLKDQAAQQAMSWSEQKGYGEALTLSRVELISAL
jgi:hypothetical protein